MATDEQIHAAIEHEATMARGTQEHAQKNITTKFEKNEQLVPYDIRILLEAQYTLELHRKYAEELAKDGATPTSALRAATIITTKAVFKREKVRDSIARAMGEVHFNACKDFVFFAEGLIGEITEP